MIVKVQNLESVAVRWVRRQLRTAGLDESLASRLVSMAEVYCVDVEVMLLFVEWFRTNDIGVYEDKCIEFARARAGGGN